MEHVALFLRGHTIILAIVIIFASFFVYAIVKRLAKLALFLLVVAAVAYAMLKWIGKL